MDSNLFGDLFMDMDDEEIDDALEELGIEPEALVMQIAHAEAVAEAAYSAPYGGGLVPVTPLEHAMIHGIDSSELLSRVMQSLLRVYPPNIEVIYMIENEDDSEAHPPFQLSELDQQLPDTERMLYLPACDAVIATRTMQSLQQIIAQLRAPEGCPWDREQTHQSLTRYMIEEAYEAVHAIESGDPIGLAEELGDVLLQVLLHAQIAEEQGTFLLEDIFELLADKLIRRHPHVFGESSIDTSGEVVIAWDQIKHDERSGSEDEANPSIVGTLPATLPALARAQTILRRAASHGLDVEQVGQRAAAALNAADDPSEARIAAQLAAIANDARQQGIDAESVLRRWTEQFERLANESPEATA